MKNLWKVLFVVFCAGVIISLPRICAQKTGESEESKERICPVCKTPIAKDAPQISSEYKGKTYYFCCEKCKAEFEKDPEKYATGKEYEGKKVYVCPMKECDYKSADPGKCPKCGMELRESRMSGDWCHKEHMGTICPVCKNSIDKDAPCVSADFKGKGYYFCSEKCKAEFEKNPAKYTACSEHMHRTAYVCPMKECDYRADKPGKCPKCGMELKETIECYSAKTKRQKLAKEPEKKDESESDIEKQ